MEQVALDITKNERVLELLPLQEYMLDETRKAFRRSKKIVLQAGCGAGKTIIACQIAKNALAKGKTVLFIADRIVLCNQTSDVFMRYGVTHGVIQAQNARFDINQPCQICSIQTLKMRGCPKSDVIIIDECHVLHDAHKEIMSENPESYILGLSASPYTKGLGKYFDFHIQPVPVKKLIEKGYLVPFDIYGPTIADLTKLKVRAGEYTEESLSETFDKVDIIGDVVRLWKKLTPGRKTIVFGVNVAHIKHLSDQFNGAGISACQINAYQTETEREEALNGFIKGNTTVLCSVEVATKGFDCPEVDVAVLAVATKSMIKWTQTTGRAFRTYPGKKRATILDMGGNAERLGFPDDYEFFGLDDGNKKKAAERIRKEKIPKACPSCAFIKPVGVRTCPACGFTPDLRKDVEAVDGDLKKLQRKVVREYTIEQKQSFLAQLTQYAENQKMKVGKGGCYGWAIHKYVEKFGVAPSGKINWAKKEPISEEVSRFIMYQNIKYAKRRDK
jgi:superfamily II DNA or RNA helicase